MKLKAMSRTVRETIPLALFLFFLWLIFTEKTNWEHLLLGAIVAALFARISFFMVGGRLDPNLNWKVALRFFPFAALLSWEIMKASWDVLTRVFRPSLPISPRIIEFDSILDSDIAKTMLANSITLTPGTVTVEIEGKRFYVHCLAQEHESGLLEGKLERMVAWLFAEGPDDMRGLR
ncbi:MAG: Na+/H+ antiporter subunit E [Actinomycetia bacterium]|nr:Na+/H+ antiporter subunit E [Actinomycetota bacterium]MCG2795226.1 Na+/H+ antiporter subunit E [Actinomycetes bacterium]